MLIYLLRVPHLYLTSVGPSEWVDGWADGLPHIVTHFMLNTLKSGPITLLWSSSWLSIPKGFFSAKQTPVDGGDWWWCVPRPLHLSVARRDLLSCHSDWVDFYFLSFGWMGISIRLDSNHIYLEWKGKQYFMVFHFCRWFITEITISNLDLRFSFKYKKKPLPYPINHFTRDDDYSVSICWPLYVWMYIRYRIALVLRINPKSGIWIHREMLKLCKCEMWFCEEVLIRNIFCIDFIWIGYK